MTEEIKQDEPLPFEPVRHYTAVSKNFKLDWNMLLYTPDEDESAVIFDWNKLVYDEEQLQEFHLQQKERFVRPNLLEYLTKPIQERTEMERFFLAEAGFSCDDEKDETDADYDSLTSPQ